MDLRKLTDRVARRNFCRFLLSAPLTAVFSRALAQTASDVNSMIKSLAPIDGQSRSGGYRPQARLPIVVEQKTVFVDPSRHVELEVFFEYDSDRITPTAQAQLKALGEALASPQLSHFRYLIAGHTDASGSDAFNVDLSQRRANAVLQYLTRMFAIDPQRLMVVGFGYRRLKRPDAPRAAINRRVEVLLIVP
jgi:outer membrane protein OmpA-like peptidoglycan-associated protein